MHSAWMIMKYAHKIIPFRHSNVPCQAAQHFGNAMIDAFTVQRNMQHQTTSQRPICVCRAIACTRILTVGFQHAAPS